MSKKYIFGYGSLMNSKSLQKTIPGKKISGRADLIGYQRKFNFYADGYLFLNIVSKEKNKVRGVLIAVSDRDLKKMKKREAGYKCVEVTDKIVGPTRDSIFAFIAPNKSFPDSKILRSYLNTCLGGLPKKERARWIKETVIENPIEEDRCNPQYENVDPTLDKTV